MENHILMNVLYISYDGMTDPLGQSQVIPYLIGLRKKGHDISIISCEKKNKFEKQQPFNWHPVPYSTLPSFLSKQLNLLRIKQKAFELCKKNTPNIVHCRSYMAALIGLQLKNKYKIKFIFDMRGFWADERIDGEIWNLKNPIHKQFYNYFKKKEIEFLKKADHTISLTQNAKDEILSWKSLQNKSISIEVIPCCADLNLFSSQQIQPTEQEHLRTQLKINPSDLIISYLGSIGTWYMLNEMLDFFKILLSKKANAKFLFITQDDKQSIISMAESKDISSDKILIYSAVRNEVPLYLSLSNISLYFIKPLYSKKASSPTKTGEIMGMGIPIITNSGIGDSDSIITESGAGMLVKKFTDDEYNRIIEQINVLLNVDKTKVREAAFNYFSLDKGVELYDKVYRKLE
jgi:Glycosyltransferase Family 4/Glycosyl transferases group 1